MNPFESIRNTIVFSSKDWSLCKEDAWIYGIVVGWKEVLDTICIQHNWNPQTKERIANLHKIWSTHSASIL